MLCEEEEDAEFVDAVGEQDEHTGNPGEPVDVSINALSDSLKKNTILVKGEIVRILVDTGSSDGYIHHKIVSELGIPYEYVKPFTVVMGDGSHVTSCAKCPKSAVEYPEIWFLLSFKNHGARGMGFNTRGGLDVSLQPHNI